MIGDEEFPAQSDQIDNAPKGASGTPADQRITDRAGASGVDIDKDRLEVIKTRARIIRKQIDGGQEREEIGGYLGMGHHGSAFLIEGKVVKIYHTDRQDVEEEAKRLEKLRDIPNAIQIVAADPDERILVTELLPGENIMHRKTIGAIQYTDIELVALINTIIEVNRRGLLIDLRPGNFNHDRDTGFYILDVLDDNAYPTSIAEQVMGLHHMLTYEGPYKERPSEEILASERMQYQNSRRQLTVVRDNFPDLFEEIKSKDHELRAKGGGFIKEGLYPDDAVIKAELGQLNELGLTLPQST